MAILSVLWGLKWFRYIVWAGLVAIAIMGAVHQLQAAAVERAALEREVADLKALNAEAERQLAVVREVMANEAQRAEERARENYLLRVEIDGYKTDVASGVSLACPSDAAYDSRMRALWPNGGGPGVITPDAG